MLAGARAGTDVVRRDTLRSFMMDAGVDPVRARFIATATRDDVYSGRDTAAIDRALSEDGDEDNKCNADTDK